MLRHVCLLSLCALSACASIPQNTTLVDQVLYKLDVGLSEEERARIEKENLAAKEAEEKRKEEERIAKLRIRVSSRLKPEQFKNWDEKEYRAHGISKLRLTATGVIEVKEYDELLNRVYDRLKASSGVNNVPGRVHIVMDTSLAASALPDNNIIVSFGYLKNLDSEDAVAALLAHELSHVLLGHTTGGSLSKDIEWVQSKLNRANEYKQKSDQRNAQNNTALMFNPGAPAPQQPAYKPAEMVGVGKGQANTMQQLEVVKYSLKHFVEPVISSNQEIDADRLALDLLQRAGYSADGLFDWLNVVHNWESNPANKGSGQDEPNVVSKIVESMIKEKDLTRGYVQGLTQTDTKTITKTAFSKHPKINDRREKVNDYVDHDPNPTKPVAKTALFKNQPAINREARKKLTELETFVSAVEASQQQDFAKVDTLVAELRQKKSPALNTSAGYLLQANLAGSKAQYQEALALVDKSANSPNASWYAYEVAVGVLMQQGRRDDVNQWMEKASSRFDDVELVQPRKVVLWARLGNRDKAVEAYNHCITKMPSVRSECEDAAQGKLRY